jgi:putative chitinase
MPDNLSDSVKVYKKAIPLANINVLTQVDAAIKKYGVEYGVDTPKRIAAFMAQAAHESVQFNFLKEIWDGKGWQATYQGRMGNTNPGDGYKYRGRGIFQTTGKDNYKAASLALFKDLRLLNNPEILEQPEYATLSALFYWKSKKLSELADKGDFLALTKRINPKALGYSERVSFFTALTSAIAISPSTFLAEALKKKSNTVQKSVANSVRDFRDYFGFFLFGK